MGATLIFPDESGFSLVSPLKRTWAPRGHTPTIRTSIAHQQRVNLIGALCVSPAARHIRLHCQAQRQSMTGESVLRFLQRVLRCVRGPIVMLWDRHPIHRRRKVKAFLEQHTRIHVYPFPTAAPELNPTEFVWTQVSAYTASSAPRRTSELHANVRAGVARTRRSPKRLWACIAASDLPWKR